MAGILPDSGLGAGDLMKLLRSFNERLHSGYESIKVFEQSFLIPVTMAVTKRASHIRVKLFLLLPATGIEPVREVSPAGF